MPGFAQKQKSPEGSPLITPARQNRANPQLAPEAHHLLEQQRVLGNQEIQRLLHLGMIQPKLKISQPHDKYEQEAERIADQVMLMPASLVRHQPEEEEEKELQPKLETKPGCCSIERQMEEGEELIQTKTSPGHTQEITSDLESRIHALKGGGQPLPDSERAFFEPRFGYDLSQLRIHVDGRAAETARAMNAQAYTVGRDVVFGAKQYDPGTHVGRHLLAHELTHVVQQAFGGASSRPEQRADATAASVMRGEAVSPVLIGGTSQSVQMKPDDPASKSAKDTPESTGAPGSWTTTLDRFGHNKSELTDDHRKSLDALVTKIAAQVTPASARATIMITGHTDTSGDEKYNESLGLKRANVVKAMLEEILSKKKVSADRVAKITTKSSGEKNLAIETADNVREPLNRRVIITVKIEGPSLSVSPPTPIPSPDVKPEEKEKPLDLSLPPDYKLPEESWWERTERERKIIEEYDRKHPRKPKSLTDYLVEGVTKVLEPLISELPKGLRDKARYAIRKGIEAGTEKACEAAIDASGVSGEKAEAMKAACKAALKSKTGSNK